MIPSPSARAIARIAIVVIEPAAPGLREIARAAPIPISNAALGSSRFPP